MAPPTTAVSSLLALLMVATAAAALTLPDPPLPQLPGIIVINGTLPCTVDPPTAGSQTPGFPNATVLLMCGKKLVANTTTDANGIFEILLHVDGIRVTLVLLLNGCKLMSPTPLSACNASLPTSGILQSALQVLPVGVVGDILSIVFTAVKFVFSN